jgi:prephenate dehydrogenase
MENDPLMRSMKEEREMLLAHRDRLRKTLTDIIALVDDHDETSAESLLHQVGNIAETALKL